MTQAKAISTRLKQMAGVKKRVFQYFDNDVQLFEVENRQALVSKWKSQNDIVSFREYVIRQFMKQTTKRNTFKSK